MKQFILNSEPNRNGQVRLEGGDYRYLARVRRIAPGEYFPALLPDGAGVKVRVLSVDSQAVVGEVVREGTASDGAASGALPQGSVPPIILLQALPKGDKMDLIVRQAAEGGVAEIVPFASEFSLVKPARGQRPPRSGPGGHGPGGHGPGGHSPLGGGLFGGGLQGGGPLGSGRKLSRWERIIKEARQQSGSAVATAIHQPLSMDGLFAYWERLVAQHPGASAPGGAGASGGAGAFSGAGAPGGALGLLFHHLPLAHDSLHEYLDSSPETVALAVGPEGGFSSAEAERFLAAGFKPVTVGDTILRAETAALYAQAAVRVLLLEKDSWETR